jgi:hypothetical protein
VKTPDEIVAIAAAKIVDSGASIRIPPEAGWEVLKEGDAPMPPLELTGKKE